MKKIIFSTIIGSFLIVNTAIAALPSAKESRNITNKATAKATKALLTSAKGKEVYNSLRKIFEKNISSIANKGFYDTFTITIYNSDKLGVEKLMKKLSKKDQGIMRKKIIKELEAKGYKITYNQYWDNSGKFGISTSW